MYLKRLDLQGFKSFPEKVKLEFNKGITSVVGPNGSGKSNISDSVRWVLGEQKAKSLRGDKMEDVIFAGTQSRRALGFAEVSITIDNQDHKLPIEYTEVTVTRRVFRSGDSDYLINGTVCRLKDVHELFMDTGIGREGYSIIGQGKIDEILSSKSDDRRRLFEEAAGIVKYKNRRQEAVTKLERQKQNLLRVEDIIRELEAQIMPLESQSEDAKKYLAIREKLKNCEVNLFRMKADNFEQELSKLSEIILVSSRQITSETQDYQQNKDSASKMKEHANGLTEEIQSLNDALILITTEIEKKEGKITLCSEQLQNLQKNMEGMEKEIEAQNLKIEKSKNEAAIHHSKLTAIDVNLDAEKTNLSNLEEEFSKLSLSLNEDEAIVEQYKTNMIEKIRVTTDVKGALSKIQAMQEQFETRRKQLDGEKGYLQSQANDNKTHIQAVEKRILNIQIEQETIKSNLEKLKLYKKNAEAEIAASGDLLGHKMKSITEKKSRLKLLTEMEKDHEGFFKSVKSVLALKEKGENGFSGICGAVGELLHVEKKYETAIETALGGSLQNIVCEKEEDAKKAISYLKQNQLGRATFLPLSSINARGLGGDKFKLSQEKGFLGIASELVRFEKKYEPAVGSLLGRILIMEDIDTAVLLARKYSYAYRIVTLEGDVLSPGGAMTGGSAARKSSSIFGRSREMNELRDEVQELTKQAEELEKKIASEKHAASKHNASIEECLEQGRELHIQSLSSQQDIEQTKIYLKEQTEKLESYDIEERQLRMQCEQTSKNIAEKENSLKQLEVEIAEIDGQLLEHQHFMQNVKSGRDELLNNITALKIKISNFEQNQNSAHENLKRIEIDIAEAQNEIRRFENEIKLLVQQKMDKLNESKEISAAIEKDKIINQQKQLRLGELAEERKNALLSQEQLEKQSEEKNETINQLKNNVFKLETRKEAISEEKHRVFAEIWEEYEITYQMAKHFEREEAPSISQLQKEATGLRGEMKALGPVNVDAIEQFKEVKERFEFLSIQKEDICQAEEKLQQIISELSELMEKQFREQFELISQNFDLVFKEMFGGGKAYLKLAEENNVLESGIEIIAQPPGKNLQNMMLLSGGERALTAIAILFSILKMKPSPFCVLDEIEAALDDANVKRFASYLRKFSGETQFIVITHRKGTMEEADVMYGVTMQEQGVSKIVSVKFSNEAVS